MTLKKGLKKNLMMPRKNRMARKSQVTMFIIAGIAIFTVIALLFSLRSSLLSMNFETKSSPFQTYVEECLSISSSQGLVMLGLQGGYTSTPHIYFNVSNITVGFGYYDGFDNLSSLDEMKAELESYIDDRILVCVNDFESLERRGYTIIEKGLPSSSVEFTDNRVIVEMDYPVTYKFGNSDTELTPKLYSIDFPIRFKKMHEMSKSIVTMKKSSPEYLNLSMLGEMYADVYVMTYPEGHVFIVEDPGSNLLQKPYRFVFASYPLN